MKYEVGDTVTINIPKEGPERKDIERRVGGIPNLEWYAVGTFKITGISPGNMTLTAISGKHFGHILNITRGGVERFTEAEVMYLTSRPPAPREEVFNLLDDQ